MSEPMIYLLPEGEAASLYVDNVAPGGERGDSGVDLRFPAEMSIDPGPIPTIVDLLVRARCVRDAEYVPYEIRPRSSIGKTALSLANSIGTVDRGYTGTLKVAIRNHDSAPVRVGRGTSLFQITLPDLAPALVRVVDASHPAFGETRRGDGGFGSTGASGSTGAAGSKK